MSDDNRMERMEKLMDNLSGKVDEVLSVLGDIKANERVNALKFRDIDKRHDDIHEDLKEFKRHVRETYARHDQVEPLLKAKSWIVKTVLGAVFVALLSLVVYQPAIINKQDSQRTPKAQNTEGK